MHDCRQDLDTRQACWIGCIAWPASLPPDAVKAACRVRRGRCSIPPEIVQPEPGDHAAVADERLELGVVGLAVGRRRAWLDALLLAQPAKDGIDGFDDALGGLRRPGVDRNELSGQRTRTIIA